MKHLKYLQTTNDFESFKNSEGYVLPNVSYIVETESVSFEPYVDLTVNYLTIEALEDGLTAKLSHNACEYCVDGGDWKTLAANTATEAINAGHTLSFKGKLTPSTSYGSYGIGTFTISKKCNLKGNCMSMLFGDNAADNYSLEGKNYAFYNLFYNCINIITVSENFLPATTLTNSCYDYMFSGCTSLVNTPELPATTLADNCYEYMFRGCTSLTTAPELPATTLLYGCYCGMFSNCTSLTTAPELPATTLAVSCYSFMFKGCASLVTAPELPAKELSSSGYEAMFKECTNLMNAPVLLPAKSLRDNCYSEMFYGCTSLINAPTLPAGTLLSSCYKNMFYNCSKINYITMLATNISANNCLNNWVYGVASSGTFVKHPNMTTLPIGSSGIPEGWTVVDAA